MIDLFLRAGNAGALASACPWLRGMDEETGERFWIHAGPGFAFDPIGPLETASATYDENGEELTPPVIDGRFHANLRCTQEVAAQVPETMLVNPAEPRRVWA